MTNQFSHPQGGKKLLNPLVAVQVMCPLQK